MSIQLFNGDAREIIKQIPDESINMILCDPPYGIGFVSSRTKRKEKIENDGYDEWLELIRVILPEFKRVLTPTGCCCCCGGGGKTPVTAIFTVEATKHFHLIQTLVWKKFIGLGWRYRPSYENIVVLSKDKNTYDFYDTSKKCSNVIEGINQDIPQYRGNEAGMSDEHPTQKPVPLMRRLIEIHSKKGDTVADFFMGTGATGVAAVESGRNFIGVEIQQKYYDIAKRRIESATVEMFV